MDRTVPAGAAMVVDYRCAMEILGHEAIVRQAYKDSVGVWTWSVGWIRSSAGMAKGKLRGRARVDAAFTLGLAAYNLIRLPKLLVASG